MPPVNRRWHLSRRDITRPSGMEFSGNLADDLPQPNFDRRVDIFNVHPKRVGALFVDLLKPSAQ